MLESLEDLQQQLENKGGRRYFFEGKVEETVKRLLESLSIDLVVFNRDYTPYSVKRDEAIEKLCQKNKVAFRSFDDALLHAPSDVLKADGKPYSVFTPYYRAALELPVLAPQPYSAGKYFTHSIAFAKKESYLHHVLPQRREQAKGGRKAALDLLKQDVSHYETVRDFPALDRTTHLSAHLKFTTCSIREVYRKWRHETGLIRSLYWRDFFTSIAYFSPRVFGETFRPAYNDLPWSYDRSQFRLWCEGKTGFPIVDAGMRQLNQTGFMHNRVRMIAASFLVKDLRIDWRWGEKYFAERLIDYDPAVNNGNWQWIASTGCDSQPYFRIFNPWAQQKKFDPDCEYISLWIPELSGLPPEMVHSWHTQEKKGSSLYPSPMVDHAAESKKTLQIYRASS